jgi:hypothetical protein
MSENNLQLDRLESQLLARAADVAATRRRIGYSVLAPVALIALLLAIFWREAQPRLLLWLFVGYVAVGIFEKVSYGFAVLGYKGLVRKLLARVNELERRSAGG